MSPPKVAEPTRTQPAGQSQAKILVVDDDERVLKTTASRLSKAGYEVVATTKGAQCIDLCLRECPELVLLDVQMPDADGRELCRSIKLDPRFPDMFVILISGVRTDSQDKTKGLDHLADDYIVRPVAQDELLARVRLALRLQKTLLSARRSRQRYRESQEAAGIGSWDWNVRTGELWWSAQTYRLHGLEPGTVEPSFDLHLAHVPAEDRESYQRAVEQVLREAGPFEYEIRIRRSDGGLCDCLVRGAVELADDGEPATMRGTILDITERKRAQARERHLADVLAAIRNVNQLIAQEKNPGVLIRGACRELSQAREYNRVWIALFDEAGSVTRVAASNVEPAVLERFQESLRSGVRPECWKHFNEEDVSICHGSEEMCENCPLRPEVSDRSVIMAPLRHGRRVWGILEASLPPACASDPEELELFGELAGDLGLAMHAIDAEARMRDLARFPEENPYPILRISGDGTVLYANRKAGELLAEQGSGVGEKAPPAWADASAKAICDAGVLRLEYQSDHRHHALHFVGIAEADCTNVYGVDITERRKIEVALQESHRLLDTMGEMARVGGWEVFPETRQLRWTDETYRIHEVPLGQMPSIEEAIDFFHPDDRDRLREAIDRAVQHGEPYDLELRFFTAKGRELWTRTICRPEVVDGKVVRLTGSFQDVTERRCMEDELRTNTAILQAAMDCSTAGIAIADAPDGALRYVNDAGLRILAATRQEVVNRVGIPEYVRSWRLLDLSGRPLEEDEVPLTRALRYGETCDRQFIIRRGDDQDRVVWASAAPILDPDGKITAAIVVFPDITELRQAQQEREALQAQLHQTQRLESIGRLAGGVAHDFNNMLAVILGNAELALTQMKQGQSLEECIHEIRKAAQRSASLTRQLLAFARRQTIAPESVDLNDTIAGMLKMLKRLIGEEINLVWAPDPDVWQVHIDPGQIDQVLVNLCVNARDAIDGVGKITIETGNVDLDEAYCREHVEFNPGRYVCLTVSDDGCGMEAEVLEQVFEPFFSSKGQSEVSGLGLATVYGIIKQNDGFVNVYSEPGDGTSFRIYFRAHAAEPKRKRKAEPGKELPLAVDSRSVLLVEDEPSLLRMGIRMLRGLGYTVLPAATPPEAIELAQDHPGPIDLLVTDVVMPEMNGRDLAERLQSFHPGMGCLFVSGYTANVIAHRGVLDEGVHFLQKPFSQQTLGEKIREVLADE